VKIDTTAASPNTTAMRRAISGVGVSVDLDMLSGTP
jgi:hypothetical protein